MAVVGSTITVDLHITEDADLESLQAAVRQRGQADPELAQGIRESVETHAKKALEDGDVGTYDLSVTETLVTDRLAGAPRERITVDLDVEGDKAVVAAADDAVGAPERARIADAVEAVTTNHLAENDLSDGADVIVSVTPIQFR